MVKGSHRTGKPKRTEHSSTWEGSTEGQHGVAKGRKRWKALRTKALRRTGKLSQKFRTTGRHRLPLPEEP